MDLMEKRQIEYLKKEKERLLDGFVGACEEINQQIKDVKSGEWRRRILDGSKETFEGHEINRQDA